MQSSILAAWYNGPDTSSVRPYNIRSTGPPPLTTPNPHKGEEPAPRSLPQFFRGIRALDPVPTIRFSGAGSVIVVRA